MPYDKGTSLGYKLHRDECYGPTVELDGVPAIPTEMRRLIDAGAEDCLPAHLIAASDQAIEAATRAIRERKLAAKRGSGCSPKAMEGLYVL